MQLPIALYCTLVLYRTLVEGSQPEVLLKQGTLKGIWEESIGGRPYATFLGIPYAKPPVGKHRFKEPVPNDPWIGDYYNATREPPRCLQLNHNTLNTPFAILGSEDCLYLNVYTPVITDAKGTDGKLLDVIVFIHGGAFMFLTSSVFGGSILMEREIVLVTINYRLGPLGFMSTGDAILPGNNGLKDQVLALKWVQENIAAFGGDPDRVTIAGFSAGSASVHYHILSPLSKGLFKAAICASGSSLNPWTIAENSREKAFFVARSLGCPTGDSQSLIKCLRNRPAEHIVGMTRHYMPWLYNPFSPYALVVEPPGPNAFLPDTPINLLKQGKGVDVPILFTFTKDEGLYPGAELVGWPENLKEIRERLDELLPSVLDYNYTTPNEEAKLEITKKIIEHYKVDLNTKEGVRNFVELIGDRLFFHGITKAAKLHASLYSSPVYMYRFSYMGENSLSLVEGGSKELGVCHADDVLYVFSREGLSTQETEADRQVSRDMVNLWVSFAVNGTLDGQSVGENLPKIAFTDIRGPSLQVPMLVEEMGEEKFWDSLNLLENIATVTREEL
ncbi:esterase FE4 [Halyomorpha halys]|uniref:esterase FE4 n=1 Tax=Halyomorpha halys TaxID=286706 RepID=UPI0006D4E14D|nr:esterase FE4-like [Halyomorpha halys]XP_014273016.1 esterase FE4-like [Halyomorpha halys]